jgi:tRNA threonylcarbamoyladenosine biosynthesis protein TsaB
LRIAAGIAKGIAHGAGVPLYAVSSLALVAAGAEPPLAAGRYIATLDAMRGERYAQRVRVREDGRVAVEGDATIVASDQLDAADLVIGPLEEAPRLPHARGVARMLEDLLAAGPVDLAAWEPSYGRLAEAQVRWEAAHGRPLESRP